MLLRKSLIVDKPSKERLACIRELTDALIVAAEAQNDCTELLFVLFDLTGVSGLDSEYFRTLYTHSSPDEFTNYACLPRAVHVPDLSREELVDITQRAMNVGSWDCEYYMELLDVNVPLEGASNLIFYPPEDYKGEISEYDPTAEEIVDIATAADNVILL
ncbi:hypothetical protein [Terasakiella pusilla]|uniref:hypothetical protein n=1 Tax=Terasakiella pusilla TaxID=64973 RepID=UPI00057040DD|nr:hypothetical protein [Terasakiella pusilla]